ncbi:hypothetical protein BU23DRAFT_195451 [Bimuria novae-zelandiae CBS 107.79]|uniref:Zinc-binding loop region of homing endonuclease domain-containing protein n=1 Tax=Bimuria novae-zelandiae CBS 107.79 TaxID=1447943 RepID=A0A6A5VD79_9PLEO|nr:hypothetical protein BU23DRAFT_195451 [Bimuria novae-zelandiae CBS 107.79]
MDCWFWKQSKSDTWGYATHKLSTHGSHNKQRVHSILYFARFPNAKDNVELAHRCGRGLRRFGGCVNPRHLQPATAAENAGQTPYSATKYSSNSFSKDHKDCKGACSLTCPHTPRCIWTDTQGRYLPCRNVFQHPCTCEGYDCWDQNSNDR